MKSVPFIAQLYPTIKGTLVQCYCTVISEDSLLQFCNTFSHFQILPQHIPCGSQWKTMTSSFRTSLGRKDTLHWKKSQNTQRHEMMCPNPWGKWKQNQSCAITTASSFYSFSSPKKIKHTEKAAGRNCIAPRELVLLKLHGLIRPWFASSYPQNGFDTNCFPISSGYIPASSWRHLQVASYFSVYDVRVNQCTANHHCGYSLTAIIPPQRQVNPCISAGRLLTAGRFLVQMGNVVERWNQRGCQCLQFAFQLLQRYLFCKNRAFSLCLQHFSGVALWGYSWLKSFMISASPSTWELWCPFISLRQQWAIYSWKGKKKETSNLIMALNNEHQGMYLWLSSSNLCPQV